MPAGAVRRVTLMETPHGIDAEIIYCYFPDLDAGQRRAFALMGDLYRRWNERINVVSRRDIDNIYPAHILHSLAIAAMLGSLAEGTGFMDLGCGGGFPGIPLAVMYPQCRFHLVDRVGKKITVAAAIAEELGLKNVTFRHGDASECHDKFDYVVSRAVMQLEPLVKIAFRNIGNRRLDGNRYAPGLICLKGGDLDAEIAAVSRPVVEIPVTDFFNLVVFRQKEIVYVPNTAR